MATITVRTTDEALEKALKEQSKRRGLSVNQLIVQTLQDALLGRGKKPRRYDDLDALAGSWSVAEAAAFDASLGDFEAIDGELWR